MKIRTHMKAGSGDDEAEDSIVVDYGAVKIQYLRRG